MRLRRTWPQRLIILVNLVVVGACVAAAWGIRAAEETALEIPRVAFGSEVLTPSDIDAGDPVTFLLVGADSSVGLDDNIREGRNTADEDRGIVRADTMLLLRVDPKLRSAAIVAIPRDLYVPVPGSGRSWKISSALSIGGPEKLVETISTNLDVEINHYIQVDFAGFADVIDAMGGVYVWAEQPVRDRKSGLFLGTSGCHQLDGAMSLAYVRGRNFEVQDDDGDWRRIDVRADLDRSVRQQDFLVLALESVVGQGGRNPGEIRRIIEASSDAVVFDNSLTPDDLIDLGNSFSDFNPQNLDRQSLPVFDVIIPDDGSDPVPFDDPLFAELAEERAGQRVLFVSERAAEPVLDVIRGEGGWVTQADIAVAVGGQNVERSADALRYLGERGFVVQSGPVESVDRTVIRFAPEDADRAELLARYLIAMPAFELVAPDENADDDAPELTLLIGADYEGVAILPRAEVEVEAAMDTLRAPPPTTTDPAPTTTTDAAATTAPLTTTAAPTTAPPTTAPPTNVIPADPVLTVAPVPDDEVLGRAPEGVACP